MDTWQSAALILGHKIVNRRDGPRQTPVLICGVSVRMSLAAATELARWRDILGRGGLNSSALWWVPGLASQYRALAMVALWRSRSSRTKAQLSDTLPILKSLTRYSTLCEITRATSYDPLTHTLTDIALETL